jgi:hypothetical protein
MTNRSAPAKYRTILEANGYSLFSTNTNDASCWIKDEQPDINVCNLSGLWASEHASDTNGFGNDEKSLINYFEFNA